MKPEFIYTRTAVKGEKRTFAVSVKNPDGTVSPVGTVIHWWITHLQMMGWEAIGADGHRAVHKTQRQASLALIWTGVGYPFPISRSA